LPQYSDIIIFNFPKKTASDPRTNASRYGDYKTSCDIYPEKFRYIHFLYLNLFIITLLLSNQPIWAQVKEATVPLYYSDTGDFAGTGTFIYPRLLVTTAAILADLENGGLRLKDGRQSLRVHVDHKIIDGTNNFQPRSKVAQQSDIAFIYFEGGVNQGVAAQFTGEATSLEKTECIIISYNKGKKVAYFESCQRLEGSDNRTLKVTHDSKCVGQMSGSALFVKIKGELQFAAILSTGDVSKVKGDDLLHFTPVLFSQTSLSILQGLVKNHPEYFKGVKVAENDTSVPIKPKTIKTSKPKIKKNQVAKNQNKVVDHCIASVQTSKRSYGNSLSISSGSKHIETAHRGDWKSAMTKACKLCDASLRKLPPSKPNDKLANKRCIANGCLDAKDNLIKSITFKKIITVPGCQGIKINMNSTEYLKSINF